MTLTAPHLTARARKSGRVFVWQPGPGDRRHGWRAVSLKDGGAHSGLEVADRQARWLNAILAAWRLGDHLACANLHGAWRAGEPSGELEAAPYVECPVPGLSLTSAQPGAVTVANLLERYGSSVAYRELAPSTRREYASRLRAVAAAFAARPVAELTRRELRDYYQAVYEDVSLAAANARLRVFSAVLSFAVDEELREDNPLYRFRFRTADPRVVVWRPEEAAHLVAVADELGQHGIADAFVIALHTAQRRGDILALPRLAFRRDRLAVRQAKRGARVDIPYTPALRSRLGLILERRAELDLEHVPTLIVDDSTRAPFKPGTFSHRFAEVRARAALTAPAGGRQADEPAFGAKQFLDTRDTAITRLALADAEAKGTVDLFSIAAITGHSLPSVTRVLRHYVATHPSMAERGIAALSAWLEQEGVAL